MNCILHLHSWLNHHQKTDAKRKSTSNWAYSHILVLLCVWERVCVFKNICKCLSVFVTRPVHAVRVWPLIGSTEVISNNTCPLRSRGKVTGSLPFVFVSCEEEHERGKDEDTTLCPSATTERCEASRLLDICFFLQFFFFCSQHFDRSSVVFRYRPSISAECRYEWQSLSNHFKDCDYSALNLASLHIWLLANLNPRAHWAVWLHHHPLSPPIAFAMTNPIRKMRDGHTANRKMRSRMQKCFPITDSYCPFSKKKNKCVSSDVGVKLKSHPWSKLGQMFHEWPSTNTHTDTHRSVSHLKQCGKKMRFQFNYVFDSKPTSSQIVHNSLSQTFQH